MSTNFIQKIKDAENKARKIVEQADINAKSKLDHNKRELSIKLDSTRKEYDQKIRLEKSAAELQSEQDLSVSLENLSSPDVSEAMKEQAADLVLERIVNFLGNS